MEVNMDKFDVLKEFNSDSELKHSPELKVNLSNPHLKQIMKAAEQSNLKEII